MQELMRKEGIRATVVPNGTTLFAPAPINLSQRVILYVGRLEKIKGVQYALHALREVLATHPDTQFVIAGTGTYEQTLKELSAQLNLEDKVSFVGHASREELYQHYMKARCVVMPSVWPEPFGKVGIEALSVGRPVVASAVGGISEWLIDGETGVLVPPADAQALSGALLRLFSDNDLVERMSSHAVLQAQQFSIENHARKIVALYEEVRAAAKR